MNLIVTKWIIDEINNLDIISEILKENNVIETEVEWEDDPLKSQFISMDDNGLGEVNRICISDETYEYIIFKGRVETALNKKKWHDENNQLRDREDRVKIYEATFIIYKLNNKLNMITIGAITNVRKVINKMFKEKWPNILAHEYDIREDVFYWVLSRLRDENNHTLHPNSEMKVTGLLSYLGKTQDGNNALRASGRRVLSIMGTLAYIFSGDTLKAIRPEFQYKGEMFLIELTLNNSFKICCDGCLGKYNTYQGQEKVIALSIYIMEKIIPKVFSDYICSLNDNLWSQTHREKFIELVGQELQDIINKRMKALRNNESSIIDETQNRNNIISEIDDDLLEGDIVV